jgi:hypothetical protein
MTTDPRDVLVVWTITFDPRDFPGKYVVCGHDITPGGPRPHSEPLFVGDALDDARRAIPEGLAHHPRSPTDDPVIVESWL